jgi:hypothetical protein
MAKIISTGLIAGLVMLVASVALMWIFPYMFPGLNAEYSKTGMFRSWSDPLMYYVYLNPIILGLILSWVWQKIKTLYKGKKSINNGIKFGLTVWIISTVPGMLMTLSSFNISLLMVFTWALTGFIQLVLAGMIFGKINK